MIKVGDTFGKLSVVEAAPNHPSTGRTRWICKCSCGSSKIVVGHQLVSGDTKSCGCLHARRTHNESHTRLYRIFRGMHTRCYQSSAPEYKWYGEKGITVTQEWYENFVNFKTWAINSGYGSLLTIDRINPALGYSPENCRWVSMQIQARNRVKRKNSSSKYLGVSFDTSRNKYTASVYIDGKRVLNKRVSTEIEAAKLRDQYIIDHQLKGYSLNFK